LHRPLYIRAREGDVKRIREKSPKKAGIPGVKNVAVQHENARARGA